MLFVAPTTGFGQVREVLDEETGDLHWDLGTDFRVQYISSCRVHSSWYDQSGYRNIADSLDVFQILASTPAEEMVSCREENKGLQVLNLLRQDGAFPDVPNVNGKMWFRLIHKSWPYEYPAAIRVNEMEMRLARKGWSDTFYNSENYQAIYAAIQRGVPIVLDLVGPGESDWRQVHVDFQKTIAPQTFARAEVIRQKYLNGQVAVANSAIQAKYKWVFILDLLVLASIGIIAFTGFRKWKAKVRSTGQRHML